MTTDTTPEPAAKRGRKSRSETVNAEAVAITKVFEALRNLDAKARFRVMEYVEKMLEET